MEGSYGGNKEEILLSIEKFAGYKTSKRKDKNKGQASAKK